MKLLNTWCLPALAGFVQVSNSWFLLRTDWTMEKLIVGLESTSVVVVKMGTWTLQVVFWRWDLVKAVQIAFECLSCKWLEAKAFPGKGNGYVKWGTFRKILMSAKFLLLIELPGLRCWISHHWIALLKSRSEQFLEKCFFLIFDQLISAT